jgi:hypothetical protein
MNYIAEVSHFEIKFRKAREGEKGQYFQGVGGFFTKRTNLFKSVQSFVNYIERQNFDDSVCFSADLKDEVLAVAQYYYINEEELRWSLDSKWFWI